MLLRSRIAPTPSGYLHIGNAFSFVHTWLWVRKMGGKLRLRIDDRDTVRSKPEYVEDIFRTFEWMGLDWDEGPQTPDEQERIYSQALRGARYDEIVNQLIDTGRVFACECSRKVIQAHICNCQSKHLALNHPDTALRIATHPVPVTLNKLKGEILNVNQYDDMKDFVIRRRDGITAYQLFSLVDDIDFNINLIIRGEDLISSTAAQLYMAALLKANAFVSTTFYHHRLQYDEQGHKLSKSAGSLSLKTMRQEGLTSGQLYQRLSSLMGLKNNYTSLNEMLHSGEAFNII
jgi:glutamyl/glutaminyl-tRNA synthetase